MVNDWSKRALSILNHIYILIFKTVLAWQQCSNGELSEDDPLYVDPCPARIKKYLKKIHPDIDFSDVMFRSLSSFGKNALSTVFVHNSYVLMSLFEKFMKVVRFVR